MRWLIWTGAVVATAWLLREYRRALPGLHPVVLILFLVGLAAAGYGIAHTLDQIP